MTMYRYIALMWSRTDCDAAQTAQVIASTLNEVSPHKWSRVWGVAGLAIYTSGEHRGRMQTYRLQGERGVVLGRLFKNDYTSIVDDLDEFESCEWLKTRGQRLIDDYWGRYVAFLSDPKTGTRYVMRDPSGQFPCFHTGFRGVTIYFSDMQDVANFEFLSFTVNWDFLKTNIVLPQFRTMHTGLNEVGEIQPAECIEQTPFEKRSRFVWNPTEISQTNVIEDPEDAAAVLRETVKSTIGALAGCYDHIVHNLGGLDSSIVLACLAQAPNRPEITCINFYTRSPRGDERRYGRQVADRYGVEFVERQLDYRNVDLNRTFTANKLAKTRATFDCVELTGHALALVEELDADALTYGTGGDNVYYQMPCNLGALDYMRRHSVFGREGLRVVMEASRYGRQSLLSTICDTLRERIAPKACYEHVRDKFFAGYKIPLVNPDFLSDKCYQRMLLPYLVPGDHDLKGKYLHILSSSVCTNEYYHHFDTRYSTERVRAYFAQPIIEACLRIPTWVMTHGGIDRGLARKAFAGELPHIVARRLSKSTPGEFYRDVYENNSDFLREVLPSGALVTNGVLLKDRLEDALEKKSLLFPVQHSVLLGYVEMEAWLRSWLERRAPRRRNLESTI